MFKAVRVGASKRHYQLLKIYTMKYPCGKVKKPYRLSIKFSLLLFFAVHLTGFSIAQPSTSEFTGPGYVSSGLVLWLDASDVNADGTNPANNTNILTWKDKSPAGHDATVHTNQNPATFLVDQINGKPALRFNRVSDYKGSVFITDLDIRPVTTPDITVFTVYRQGTLAGNQAPWGSDNSDWDRFYISSLGNSNGVAPFGPAPPYYASVVGGAIVGKTRLMTMVYDGNVTTTGDSEVSYEINEGPENRSAVYFNGQLITAFTDKTHATDEKPNFYVGWDGDNSAYNGDIAEVIIYDRRLDDCEILQINKYLAEKYGENFSATKVTASASNNIICPNSSITLTASSGESYKWLRDGNEITDATSINYQATEAGSFQAVITGTNGCIDTSSAIILTKSNISAEIIAAGPLEFCSGSTVELSASAGYEYEWFADGSPLYQYSQTIDAYGSGKYTVKVIDNATGCSVTTSSDNAKQVVVNKSPDPSIYPEGATTFCEGESVILKAAPDLAEYKWYRNDQLITGTTGDTYTATQGGSYSLYVKSDKGCVNSAVANSELSTEIKVRPLPQAEIGIEGPTAICENAQATLYAPAAMNNYNWFKNNIALDEHNAQLTTNAAGSYTLQVTDEYGCSNTTASGNALKITIRPNLQVSVSIANTPVSCPGKLTTLTAQAVNGGASPMFEWLLNDQHVADNNNSTLSMNSLKAGDVVQVKLTSNAEGCLLEPSALSALYTLKLDANADCDNDGITNGVECPSGMNCSDKDQDGLPDYLDTDSDNDGRTDAEEGTEDCNKNGIPNYLDEEACNTAIILPNLFSPNGDGKNDVIKPIIPGLKSFAYLKIFNRWGNLVFESKDPNKGWDGNINGKPQPQDTYIWISSGIDRDGQTVTFKGLFSLIR